MSNNTLKILKQFGIRSNRLQNWIIRKLDSEDIDGDDLHILARWEHMDRPPRLEQNNFIGELVSDIDIKTQRYRRNPDPSMKVPSWARNDEVLTTIYRSGIKGKQHAYWARSKHKKKKKILEPIQDIIPLVKEFVDPSNQQIIKNEGFSTNLSDYPTTKDLSLMLKQVFPPQLEGKFEDHVDTLAKFGEWTIYFPRSMKGSQMCDPADLTDWCTIRKGGGNLFMDYANSDSNKFLYYILSDKEEKNKDPIKGWFSIGISYGEIIGQEYGRETIDGKQNPLTNARIIREFGQHAKSILSTIKEHYAELDGIHPVKEDLKLAARNVRFLHKWVGKSRKSDKLSAIDAVLNYPISEKVFDYILKKTPVEFESIATSQLELPNIDIKVLKKLGKNLRQTPLSISLITSILQSRHLDLLYSLPENRGFFAAIEVFTAPYMDYGYEGIETMELEFILDWRHPNFKAGVEHARKYPSQVSFGWIQTLSNIFLGGEHSFNRDYDFEKEVLVVLNDMRNIPNNLLQDILEEYLSLRKNKIIYFNLGDDFQTIFDHLGLNHISMQLSMNNIGSYLEENDLNITLSELLDLSIEDGTYEKGSVLTQYLDHHYNNNSLARIKKLDFIVNVDTDSFPIFEGIIKKTDKGKGLLLKGGIFDFIASYDLKLLTNAFADDPQSQKTLYRNFRNHFYTEVKKGEKRLSDIHGWRNFKDEILLDYHMIKKYLDVPISKLPTNDLFWKPYFSFWANNFPEIMNKIAFSERNSESISQLLFFYYDNPKEVKRIVKNLQDPFLVGNLNLQCILISIFEENEEYGLDYAFKVFHSFTRVLYKNLDGRENKETLHKSIEYVLAMKRDLSDPYLRTDLMHECRHFLSQFS